MNGTDSEPLLAVEGLSKYFTVEDSLLDRLLSGGRTYVRAVDDVDFEVQEGETLGLVGESGCGKSTLARTVLRLLEPTDGVIRYRGEDITEYDDKELRAFRSKAQMIFQDPYASLNPRYTVRRTLTEPMAVHGIGDSADDREGRVRELLSQVGLREEHLDRYPHEFSGGQRQRIGIARALSVEPDLIVADEPVSGLDVSVQAQILNLLDDIRDQMGLTMLFITHDLSVVRRISDRTAVMYLGELVEVADSSDLFKDPHHPYTQALLSSIPIPDPKKHFDRIPLHGDVPTPIDPPSGCRFHPRCPKVIPPTDWPGTQDQWKQVLRLKRAIVDETIKPGERRKNLEEDTIGSVSDEDLVDAVYNEYLADVEPLPSSVEDLVQESLRVVVDGDRESAVEILDDSFTSVCERDVPRQLDRGGRRVACHLYDEDQPGTAEETTIAVKSRGTR